MPRSARGGMLSPARWRFVSQERAGAGVSMSLARESPPRMPTPAGAPHRDRSQLSAGEGMAPESLRFRLADLYLLIPPCHILRDGLRIRPVRGLLRIEHHPAVLGCQRHGCGDVQRFEHV